ncbi:MAG TPA: hypothetical protein VFA04_10000 [Bryobacteraceae bacterium]|nr:hypothetical protein [Bryobacteraceae bacterium]
MKHISSILLAGVMACGLAFAQKQDAKDAGTDMKDAGKDVGHAAKHTGRAVKKGTKKGVHKVAGKTEEGAAKVKDKTQ